MKTGLKLILLILLLCIVSTLFLAVNFLYRDVFKYEYNNNNNSTTKSANTYKDTIIIEGLEEEITVTKYNSHLGFSINYDVLLFEKSLKSDGSVIIYYKNNKDIYLKIEKLNEKDYYESYNKNIFSETINNFNYNYKYLKNNKLYFKLTIKNISDSEHADINARFNYMIENFNID